MVKEEKQNDAAEEMEDILKIWEESPSDFAPRLDPTKKKKKKKEVLIQPDPPADNSDNILSDHIRSDDHDYLYKELLGRVFRILRENNPELVSGDNRKTVVTMRPPQVLREGTKKTVFVNFMELCKILHRQPEHVMAFLLAELGTSGSLDGQQRLVLKGRFQSKHFEGILRRYVNEYVICNGCKSVDTTLTKKNIGLLFLGCSTCGAERSVAQVKAGFVARVGHREPKTY